jgi:anti-sigma B factor antagonist
MSTSDLTISVTTLTAADGACRVMRLAGQADLTATALRDALTAEIAASPRLLLIDMTALTFIDSGAMQMIISAYRILWAQGLPLALVHPAPSVARMLDLLGVDRLIPVYRTVDEGVAAAG